MTSKTSTPFETGQNMGKSLFDDGDNVDLSIKTDEKFMQDFTERKKKEELSRGIFYPSSCTCAHTILWRLYHRSQEYFFG